MNKKKKQSKYEEAKELRYNKGLTIKELAAHYNKSERTIYRWLNYENQAKSSKKQQSTKKKRRARKYPPEIYKRIIELKKEISQRSAPTIWRILKKEFSTKIPSISTIRKEV